MKRMISVLVLVASVAVLAGCETLKGAGRDVEDAGQNVQKAAGR